MRRFATMSLALYARVCLQVSSENQRIGAESMNIIRVATFTTILSFAAQGVWAQTTYTWQELPHLAFGGGYTTYLTIGDPHGIAGNQNSITVRFWDDDGKSLLANVEGFGLVSSFTVSLSRFQQKSFAITGDATKISVGWVELRNAGSGQVDASLRFSFSDSAGNVSDVVGILPSDPNFVWTIAAEQRKSSDDTGIAVANPWSDVPLTVVFELYQGATRVPGTGPVSKTLAPYGHLAVFVSELFGRGLYNGVATLKISSSTDPFCAVALRADGNQYSSLQPGREVDLWNFSYNDGSTMHSGQWSWRYIDGYSFYGWEWWGNDWVYMRGQVDGSFVILEWELYDSNNHGTGTVLYQGTLSGNTINGTRTVVRSDGSVDTKYQFSASRAN
jgi:hypothetical protein